MKIRYLIIESPFLLIIRYETKEVKQKNTSTSIRLKKPINTSRVNGFNKLFYHPVDRTIPYCFLRTECTPSQSLLTEPHKMWVCLTKDCEEFKSAFCTCTAVSITFKTYLTQYCFHLLTNNM